MTDRQVSIYKQSPLQEWHIKEILKCSREDVPFSEAIFENRKRHVSSTGEDDDAGEKNLEAVHVECVHFECHAEDEVVHDGKRC